MKWLLDSLEILFRNWKTKLSFIIIATIFAFIYNSYMLSSKIIDVPLSYEINPTLAPLNEIPKSISIKIKGREEDTREISSKDFKAYLDSKAIKEEGSYSIPVIIDSLLKDVQGIQYSSEVNKLYVTLEKTKKSLVEVIPSFIGSLEEGLEIEEVTIFPRRVIIEGPSSLISLLQQISTKPINLSNHKESFSELIEIETPFNFKIPTKSLISININIKNIRELIQLDNIPIEFINLSSSLKVDNFKEVGWINSSFTIQDKEKALEALKKTYLIVDLSSIKNEGFFSLPVQILTKAEKQYLSYGPYEVSISIKDAEKSED